MLQFKYVGGSRKPTEHTIEKFMLFLVVGGKEMSFHDLKKLGYVNKAANTKDFLDLNRDAQITRLFQKAETYASNYTTTYKYLKIFISEQGFGIRKRYVSFYFQLSPAGNKVKIVPFSGEASPFYFEAVGRFLSKEEVKKIVADENSLYFYSRQPRLPKEEIRKLITVDRTHLQKNMRKIIVLKQEKEK